MHLFKNKNPSSNFLPLSLSVSPLSRALSQSQSQSLPVAPSPAPSPAASGTPSLSLSVSPSHSQSPLSREVELSLTLSVSPCRSSPAPSRTAPGAVAASVAVAIAAASVGPSPRRSQKVRTLFFLGYKSACIVLETALLPYLVQKMQYAISSAEFFCFSYINTLQFSIRLILLLFTLFNFKFMVFSVVLYTHTQAIHGEAC